jgi:flagellar hook-length control protein FliK
MNVDANLRPAAPVPAAKTSASSAHQRVAGDEPGGSPGAASFLSMLQALSAAPAGEVALPAVDGTVPAAPVGRDGAAQPAELDSDGLDATDATDAAVPAPQAAIAPAHADATVAGGTVPQGATAVPTPAHRPGAATMAADDRRLDGADAAAATPTLQEQQAVRAASDAAAAQAGARKADAAGFASDAVARQQIADAAEALASVRAGAGTRADSATQAREAAQATPLQPLVTAQTGAGATAVVSMFEAGLAGLRAGPGARMQERGAGRAPLADAAHAGFTAWSDATPGNQGTQPANPVYAPTAATPVPSAALAHKLHYWVAGGVQSAALQLDAFGGGAVDVHIAVRGEEAYVEFRSDQAQARKLLLDAMPQLKELLAGEGLLLSGGFVGGSAQQPAEGGAARPDRFAGARSAAQARVATVAAVAPTPVRRAAGAAIDLFV